ncbi:glycosyltransferase [Prosthecobacter sp.]|uniref:glycosyltransferase n=1 Tax=Prosthecobacter sp. TaxID=1965333 RepID=UPI00248742FE|nr:glycosyltransferase [Prosthecobacter sp.]MDI1315128.1 glycosyltransferase [Prosthecobacter sp.]
MNLSIIHVIHSIDPDHGGTTEAVRLLAQTQDSVKTTVLSSDDPKTGWGSDWPCSVRLLGPARTKFGWTPNWEAGLRDLLQPGAVVVVHGLWQYHALAAAKAARASNVPVLIYPHGMLDPWALRQSRWLKSAAWWLFNRQVFRQAAGVCFTTEDERRLAAPMLGKIQGTQVIVPLGVEEPPDSTAVLKAECESAHPVLAGRRVFLFLGRLHPKKGCDMLLQAFARWQGTDDPGRTVHLRFVGPPYAAHFQEELERQCEELGLKIGADISFAGGVVGRDKWRELAAAEVLVLPSHQENFGIVVAEALACEVPVLLSDKVNTAPFIAEYGAGLVADDTVDGTLQLLQGWSRQSADEKRVARRQARQLYVAQFAIQTARRRFLEVVEVAAAKGCR